MFPDQSQDKFFFLWKEIMFTGSSVHSAFHSSESNDMCTSSGWGLVTKILEKEALGQVCSCEFGEIFKNTFYHRTPLLTVSVIT